MLSWKGRNLFIGVVLLNFLIIMVSQLTLIDEVVFFNTYSDHLSWDKSVELFRKMRSYDWIGYAVTPILLLLKFTVLSVLIYIGVFFKDLHKAISIGRIMKVVIMSELVFIVAAAIKLLWFIFFAGNYTLDDIGFFYPLSLINLFNHTDVAPYWIYPLQTVNLFQAFYILLLALGLKKAGIMKKAVAENVVLTTYVPAIFIWVAVILFFSIDTVT